MRSIEKIKKTLSRLEPRHCPEQFGQRLLMKNKMKRLIAVLIMLSFGLSLVSSASAQTEITTTVTASSQYSFYYRATKTIDNNLSSFWAGKSNASAWWLRYYLYQEYNLEEVTIWWDRYNGSANYDIQISLDGSSWETVLAGQSTSSAATNPYKVTHSLAGREAKYLRIYIHEASSGKTYPKIYEVKVYAGQPKQPPTAVIDSISPNPAELEEVISFIGHGTDPDGTIVGYNWDFGDGNSSSSQNTTHSYNLADTYLVKFTVTDNDGATDTAQAAVTVNEPVEPPAQIPHLIRFQGLLEDTQELPLNGTFSLTFRLYEEETGGEPIWQETQANVIVEEGLLDVELGSVTELDLPFDKQYWLGVEVESDGEMAPRFKLTTVPYSFRSEE